MGQFSFEEGRENTVLKKIALYSAATLNVLFLLQHFHQNCMYLIIKSSPNFICRDKITSSLYMCVYTSLVHTAYWSCNPFMKASL